MNHRILVIDDDPKILETCQMILAPETSKAGEELESMAGELFEEEVENGPDETLNIKFEVTTANEGKIGVDEVGQHWVAFDWIGFDWVGLNWAGCHWIGFDEMSQQLIAFN